MKTSCPSNFAPFLELQALHKHCRFALVCGPCRYSGIMWSNSGAFGFRVPRSSLGVSHPQALQCHLSLLNISMASTSSVGTDRLIARRKPFNSRTRSLLFCFHRLFRADTFSQFDSRHLAFPIRTKSACSERHTRAFSFTRSRFSICHLRP